VAIATGSFLFSPPGLKIQRTHNGYSISKNAYFRRLSGPMGEKMAATLFFKTLPIRLALALLSPKKRSGDYP
jgi:hypothetical protein